MLVLFETESRIINQLYRCVSLLTIPRLDLDVITIHFYQHLLQVEVQVSPDLRDHVYLGKCSQSLTLGVLHALYCAM